MIADLVRTVMFAASAATVGLAMVVVGSYAQVYRAHRRASASGRVAAWRGLLPLHVTLIGVAYLTLVLATVYEVASRVHEPLSWRPIVYGLANTIGAWAMWTILHHSRYRKHELDRHQ